jgi:sterol desaturase/sphingolipid hydroxylase (fatty acid hydroxylase superfamily)
MNMQVDGVETRPPAASQQASRRASQQASRQASRRVSNRLLLDFGYAVFYVLLVIPLVVLLGAGFSDLLARMAPWLVLPQLPGVPDWCFVALAVAGIDAVDWLTHLANHRLTALWRLHAGPWSDSCWPRRWVSSAST